MDRISLGMKRPLVRIAAMVVRDGKMLMGKDATKWSFPSMALELGQSFQECAQRAVMIKAGLFVSAGDVIYTTNDYRLGDTDHSVTVFVDGKMPLHESAPSIMEGSEYREWQWFPLFHPPEPLDLAECNFFDDHFICVREVGDLDFEYFGEDPA